MNIGQSFITWNYINKYLKNKRLYLVHDRLEKAICWIHAFAREKLFTGTLKEFHGPRKRV